MSESCFLGNNEAFLLQSDGDGLWDSTERPESSSQWASSVKCFSNEVQRSCS